MLWVLFLSGIVSAAVPMDQAFHSALEQSESVRQSQERVVQAQERVSQVKGGLFPDVSFNATYVLQPTPSDPIAAEFSPPRQTTAQFSLVQPVFRGLREFAGLRQQKELASAEEARRQQSLQRLYQDVASSYLNVLALEQDVKNLEEQVTIYASQVTELRRRTRRGESGTSELLATEATQKTIAAELRLVRGQLEGARENFHSLTGLSREAELRDPKLVGEGKNTKLESYLGRIESRPDLRAALDQSEAAQEAIWVARGAHLPTIDVAGNYYLKRPGFLEDTKWDVAFRLTLPLFAGGTIQSEVREAASLDREAELELARLRRVAEAEIRAYYKTFRARVDHLALLKESVRIAERNVTVSQREFRRGLVRNIDVQSALAEYRNARRALDRSRFAAQLDFLNLEISAGFTPEIARARP